MVRVESATHLFLGVVEAAFLGIALQVTILP